MTATFPPSHSSRSFHAWVVGLRSIFLAGFVLILDQVMPLGTPVTVVMLFAGLGVFVGSHLAASKLSDRGVITVCLAFTALALLCCNLIARTPLGLGSGLLSTYTLSLHLSICFMACGVGAFSSWLFWRTRHGLTIELLAILFAGIGLFVHYRNLNFQFGSTQKTSQFLTTLSWSLQMSHLAALITIGSLLTLLLATYALTNTLTSVAHSTERSAPTPIIVRSRQGALRWIATSISLCALLLVIAQLSYWYYRQQTELGAMTGVGQSTKSGVSPLSFESAIGSTNEPAALVRLDSDYPENPFSPMLYLRESALSKYSGQELVLAEPQFDQDVQRSSPDEAFSAPEDAELFPRIPLLQSIFTMADHKLSFGVDYPIQITRLKNPNPQRFRSSFRVRSFAPAFALTELADTEVGDPRWSEEVRAHYLEAPTDPRYKELALKLTQDITLPVQKAVAITEYLTKNAIYTLTPNHEINPKIDPVTPFLFGDMRGYCVHFAHSITYLLRSLGIPVRIGTGYLTDLSQSKDGHVLLRMSDRHAWAEVFITGKGWIPFDPQPEHVESHADTNVDQNLLEELMGILQPDEELVAPEVLKAEEEAGDTDTDTFPLKILGYTLLIIALFPFSVKAYLRWSWILPGTPKQKLYRTYRTLLSILVDCGYSREPGETRHEHQERLAPLGISLQLTTRLIESVYSDHAHIDRAGVIHAFRTDYASLSAISKTRRIVGAFNLASAIRAISGRGW